MGGGSVQALMKCRHPGRNELDLWPGNSPSVSGKIID